MWEKCRVQQQPQLVSKHISIFVKSQMLRGDFTFDLSLQEAAAAAEENSSCELVAHHTWIMIWKSNIITVLKNHWKITSLIFQNCEFIFKIKIGAFDILFYFKWNFGHFCWFSNTLYHYHILVVPNLQPKTFQVFPL